MDRSFQHRRFNHGHQVLRPLRQVPGESSLELFRPANKGAIVSVAQQIVKDALPSHAQWRPGDVQVLIKQIDVWAGSEARDIESCAHERLIQIPGTPGKDSVRLALHPALNLSFIDLPESRFVYPQVERLISESKPQLWNHSLVRLVRCGKLFQNLRVRHPGLASACSQFRANHRIWNLEAKLFNDGSEAERNGPISIMAHKIIPKLTKTFQIITCCTNTPQLSH